MNETRTRQDLAAQALLDGADAQVVEGLTIESLEQLALASRAGLGGQAAELDPVGAAAEQSARFEAEIDAYLIAISRFEATRGMRIVKDLADRVAIRALVFGFVLPVMREVGKRWSHADLGIGHEHLVTAQLRACLLSRQHLYEVAADAPRLLATTPAGHRHEFGVLVGALLALGRGYEVIYLGADLPDKDLLWCVHKCEPQVLLLGASMGLERRDHLRLVDVLARVPARTKVWLGGPHDDLLVKSGITLFSDFESLDAALLALHPADAATRG